ncbi:MAG TPA: hypothetical protein PK718_05700 [Candidatus Methanofastidiosa archaeon]|nr:hypothetical protein [Candidatus Methanofastidiosa archaeon]HPR42024.1 hypothetical protein [Candidatus Methanofastidiosa archaeon]
MERSHLLAICVYLAVVSSLVMVSFTSYSYYSNNGNYEDVVNDPEWLKTLPEDLSREVSEEIAAILSLDEGTTERVYDAILESTDEEWANTEGKEIVNDILDYITSKDDMIDSAIDIAEYKTPVIQAIITFIPSFLADTISELLPDEIPLAALVNMDDLDNVRDIFGFMERFRYVMLALLLLGIPSILVLKPTRDELLEWAYTSTLLSVVTSFLGILLLTLRIHLAFDRIDLSFVESFGSNLNMGYLKYAMPMMIFPLALFAISLLLRRHLKQ